MFKAEELIKRLRPLIGGKADDIWNSYLASDPEERGIIQHSLENLHSQIVDDYKHEKIILSPPFKFEQLYGEYPAGMVWYADNPLYPFAFLEREFVQHIGVFGRTGAGKSFFVRGLLISHLSSRKPVLVFDWKGTYTDLFGYGMLRFEPGSESFPFCFNPLDLVGISPGHRKTYIRQVIELLIDSYLGGLKLLTVQGVEFLLLRTVDELLSGQDTLSLGDLYRWVEGFRGRMREMDWKTSALNILYKAVTGPLGSVMRGPSWSVDWLSRQRAIFELNNTGSTKDRSFFIRSLLLRLYYHFREQGPSDSMRLFIVIEEAHNILLKKGTGYESIIELMLRQIREFGVGICVVDQHPSLMSLPALGTYCTVSFNLRLKQDRDAMASALSLERPDYLGRLPPRFAIVKIQDRFLTPFLIRTFQIRKGDPPSDTEVRERMQKLLPCVAKPDAEEGRRMPERKEEAPKAGCQADFEVISPIQGENGVVRAVRQTGKKRKTPLTWEEVFLIHIYTHPLMPTVERYEHLGLNRHQGHRHRTSLLERGYIGLESIPTASGRVKLMAPTESGFRWLRERGFHCRDSDREGGIQHRYWKRRLCEKFGKEGGNARMEVAVAGNRTVDLVVAQGNRSVGVEVETGKNAYQQILENIGKCVTNLDGVVSFILDSKKAERVKEEVADQKKVAVVTDENGCVDAVAGLLRGDAS